VSVLVEDVEILKDEPGRIQETQANASLARSYWIQRTLRQWEAMLLGAFLAIILVAMLRLVTIRPGLVDTPKIAG
jgi:hypothetical protein